MLSMMCMRSLKCYSMTPYTLACYVNMSSALSIILCYSGDILSYHSSRLRLQDRHMFTWDTRSKNIWNIIHTWHTNTFCRCTSIVCSLTIFEMDLLCCSFEDQLRTILKLHVVNLIGSNGDLSTVTQWMLPLTSLLLYRFNES